MNSIENHQKNIIDWIYKIKYLKIFTPYIHKRATIEDAESAFKEEIHNMISSDKKAFEESILDLLNDNCEYLNLEEVQIKLECVGIYGKRHFRTIIYQMCYKLEISVSKVTVILRTELENLYKSRDDMAKWDISHYENLISDIFESGFLSLDSKQTLKNAIDVNNINSFSDLKIFVLINSDNSKISRYKRTISALQEIPMIQNEGLVFWTRNASITTINNIKSVLSRYGYKSSTDCLEDLLEVIRPFKKPIRIPTEKEIEDMEKISDRFLDELPLDVIDEIAVKVAELLKKSKC